MGSSGEAGWGQQGVNRAVEPVLSFQPGEFQVENANERREGQAFLRVVD